MQVMRHCVRKCCKDTVPAERRDIKTGKMVPTGAPGQAEVRSTGEAGKHVWIGVKHCASTWFCPVCGPKIMARRRGEVERCTDKMLSDGKQFIFCTYTFPHVYRTNLVEHMDKLQDVLKMFRKGRAWDLFRKRIGLVGYIRAQEVTHGHNGWHPHFHELMITKPLTESEAQAASDFLSKRWVDVCRKAGLISDAKAADAYAHAVDVRAGLTRFLVYLAKVVAWELSSVTTKATKTKGLQPFQILANACAGDAQSKKLWVEYMLGMYRKAALYWSPGLKALCEIDELTDEELLEGEVEKEPILIASPRAFFADSKEAAASAALEFTEANKMAAVRRVDDAMGLNLVYYKDKE